MSMVIEGEGFDSALRARIAAFIDEHFEVEDFAEAVSFCDTLDSAKMMAKPPIAAAAAPASEGRGSGVFGGLFERRAMQDADEGGLASWLDQVDEPFSTTLLALIDKKGLADVDVYKRANMSRQLFSHIRSDAAYRPAKKTVLALAIALELTLDEMRDLLERAGFALSRANKRDLIVEYFVTNGVYDLFAINEALYEFDQPLI